MNRRCSYAPQQQSNLLMNKIWLLRTWARWKTPAFLGKIETTPRDLIGHRKVVYATSADECVQLIPTRPRTGTMRRTIGTWVAFSIFLLFRNRGMGANDHRRDRGNRYGLLEERGRWGKSNGQEPGTRCAEQDW